ncbi:MAG: hypothetical protein ABIS03_12055 [Gemmatimonadaceae bacterium]
MHRQPLRKFVMGTFVTVALACSRAPDVGEPPAPARAPGVQLIAALDGARNRVERGDYPGADRILADFALKSRGSEESTEVSFFRALYMVDPDNRTMSMAEGIRALDIYLSTPGAKWYRQEALVLKRTAQTVVALRATQPAPRIVGRDTVFVTREAEIAALKDQLAKANAELERIKKRLANPSR